jgi:hypothetical protein
MSGGDRRNSAPTPAPVRNHSPDQSPPPGAPGPYNAVHWMISHRRSKVFELPSPHKNSKLGRSSGYAGCSNKIEGQSPMSARATFGETFDTVKDRENPRHRTVPPLSIDTAMGRNDRGETSARLPLSSRSVEPSFKNVQRR